MTAVRPVVGVMTGSGMELMFPDAEEQLVETGYGVVRVYLANAGGRQLAVIPRHGTDHSIPPHAINFRANVQAMKRLGIENLIGTSAVGSITKKLPVGKLGLVDQFIDFSKRHLTFFEDEAVHVDLTHPYDAGLQRQLKAAARAVGLELAEGLVYVSVDGPRYETAAEIGMFAKLGGDVVGMTGAPEAVLSREAGLRYASVVVSTNWGAGIQEKVSHDEVVATMEKVRPQVRALLERSAAYAELV